MYDTTDFVDPTQRAPGFHDVNCRVTWTPRGLDAAGATVLHGAYLDAESPTGQVSLGCGVEAILHDLGISELVGYEHMAPIADAVSGQLAERPSAEIRCRLGTARVDLIPFS